MGQCKQAIDGSSGLRNEPVSQSLHGVPARPAEQGVHTALPLFELVPCPHMEQLLLASSTANVFAEHKSHLDAPSPDTKRPGTQGKHDADATFSIKNPLGQRLHIKGFVLSASRNWPTWHAKHPAPLRPALQF